MGTQGPTAIPQWVLGQAPPISSGIVVLWTPKIGHLFFRRPQHGHRAFRSHHQLSRCFRSHFGSKPIAMSDVFVHTCSPQCGCQVYSRMQVKKEYPLINTKTKTHTQQNQHTTKTTTKQTTKQTKHKNNKTQNKHKTQTNKQTNTKQQKRITRSSPLKWSKPCS